MKAAASPIPRFRTLLDCCLVLLLILVITAHDQRVQARTPGRFQAPASLAADQVLFSGSVPLGQHLVNEPLPPGLAPLDDITLAAMIAAENAALTLPQYQVDLPVITR